MRGNSLSIGLYIYIYIYYYKLFRSHIHQLHPREVDAQYIQKKYSQNNCEENRILKKNLLLGLPIGIH